MTEGQRKLIRRAALAVAAAGLLVPVTVSPEQGIEGTEACASGACCRELNSICLRDGTSTLHHYMSIDRCATKVQ